VAHTYIKDIDIKRVEQLVRDTGVTSFGEIDTSLISVNQPMHEPSDTYRKISTTGVNADDEIIRAPVSDNVDGANVGLKEGFVVDGGLLHVRDHGFVAEVAKCGVVDLYVA